MFTGLTSDRITPAQSPYFTRELFEGDGTSKTHYSDFYEALRCNNRTTIVFIGGIVELLIGHYGNNDANYDSARKMMTASFVKAYTDSRDQMRQGDATNAALVDDIKVATTNSLGYLADLINAAKKKAITDKNVEGFFALLGDTNISSSPVVNLINNIQPYFPDYIEHEDFRDGLVENMWTSYRCTRVSTGKILEEITHVFKELKLASPKELIDVKNSADSPWDIKLSYLIPNHLKAMGYIYHVAAGTPIDGWRQGEKAMDKTPRIRVQALRALFTKYFEIKGKTKAINDAESLADLVTAAKDMA